MQELLKMPNIGKELARQLVEAGIETPQQLIKTGSHKAWLCIQTRNSSACYSRLCALEGAIQNVRWHQLPEGVKQELKAFYQKEKA